MLKLVGMLLFSENPGKLVSFYKKVLQKEPDWTGGDFTSFTAGGESLTIGPHSNVKGKSKEPARIMFNFESANVQAEYVRIKELGAKVVAEPYHPSEEQDMWIATLADPDGNYFQIVTPWKDK